MMYRPRREVLCAAFAPFLIPVLAGQSTRNIWDQAADDAAGIRRQIPQGLSKDPSAAALKADYERNLKDLDRLSELVKNLRGGLQTSGPTVVSAALIRDADEVRKLGKRVSDRLRSYR